MSDTTYYIKAEVKHKDHTSTRYTHLEPGTYEYQIPKENLDYLPFPNETDPIPSLSFDKFLDWISETIFTVEDFDMAVRLGEWSSCKVLDTFTGSEVIIEF